MGLLAARARHGAVFLDRGGKLEQLAQGGRACLMQRRAHRHLGGFQIEARLC